MIKAVLAALPLIGLLSTAGMVGLVAMKTAEEGRLRAEIKGQATCISDAGRTDSAASSATCPAPVAVQHRIARASVRCDEGLLKADLFAVDLSCSIEVKTLLAERLAESRRADSLHESLKAARAAQAAAVARAETRSRTQAERTARGQAAVSAAPRDADGLVVCDAVCLRDRFTPPG